MSNSNYSIDLQRLKPVHTVYVLLTWPAQFGRKLVLGTRRNWSRPRRWQFFSRRDRDETLVRLEIVSRPRRRDRDHNPGYNQGYLATTKKTEIDREFSHKTFW